MTLPFMFLFKDGVEPALCPHDDDDDEDQEEEEEEEGKSGELI